MSAQLGFFESAPVLPEGFTYESDALTHEAETALLSEFAILPFREFEFYGYTGKRRIVSFGWKYDYNEHILREMPAIPAFLLDARRVAARVAGIEEKLFEQALVTEYSPGTPIGWHRDRPVYDVIAGISLHSSCTFRLRRSKGSGWERISLTAEPRSAYVMSGAARSEWEHSIPPVEKLRYSITFRTMRPEIVRG